jgi:AraC-type DNA-binding domain-containing proteins
MDTLFYFLERMYRMTSIPLRCFHQQDQFTLFCRGFESCPDPFASDPCLSTFLSQKLQKSSKPVLEFEEGVFLYGALKDSSGLHIIAGPIVLSEIDSISLEEYAIRHKMITEEVCIKRSSLLRLTSLLETIHSIRNGEVLSGLDMASECETIQDIAPISTSMQAYMMENTEQDIQRLSYSDEKLFMQQIREGDLEGIKKHTLGTTTLDLSIADERVGKVATNKQKHFEYIVCASITLAARAAIEGGVDALSAYALADVYMQRLEKTKDIVNMLQISANSQLDFATEVRKIIDRRSRSTYVEKCKSIIANHMNKAFTLDDLAQAVGISKPYLSKQFTKEEGIGVMDYTRNKRIEAAANMLKYSSETISSIASYLCFPSQSHFGAVFKKLKGVTPQRYRENHSLIDVSPNVPNLPK